jgi:hypothetical protein
MKQHPISGHPREEVAPTLRLLWLCARCLLRNSPGIPDSSTSPVQLSLVEAEETCTDADSRV